MLAEVTAAEASTYVAWDAAKLREQPGINSRSRVDPAPPYKLTRTPVRTLSLSLCLGLASWPVEGAKLS